MRARVPCVWVLDRISRMKGERMKTPWERAHDERPKMYVIERTRDTLGGPDLMRIYRCARGHECPIAPNPFAPAYGPGAIICEECEAENRSR